MNDEPTHDQRYLEFVKLTDMNSMFLDTAFVHPRTWWKNGMRHLADTSEKPYPEALGQFFVISPCKEMQVLHRALAADLGPVTCLLCLMKMVTSDL